MGHFYAVHYLQMANVLMISSVKSVFATLMSWIFLASPPVVQLSSVRMWPSLGPDDWFLVPFPKGRKLLILIRGLAGGVQMMGHFYAVHYLQMANVLMISSIKSVFATLMSWIFLAS